MTNEMRMVTTKINPRILVIRGGALGDFVLTLPVFRALREKWPEAWIECLSSNDYWTLAKAGRWVDGGRSLNGRCWAEFFVSNGELSVMEKSWLGQFDYVISYLHDPKEVWRANVESCFRGEYISGHSRPNDEVGLPASQVLLEALTALGIGDHPDLAPSLRIGNADHGKWAFHPGSGSTSKNWPEDDWIAWARAWLENNPTPLVMVTGEVEEGRKESMVRAIDRGRLEVWDNLPVLELARRLEGCVGFVGHDSGVTHLAAALRVPCLVLWGPTCDRVWRPLNSNVTILKHPEGLPALQIEDVQAAVDKMGGPH